MKQAITFMTMLTLALFSFSVHAGHRGHGGHGGLHQCLKSASTIKEGYYAKLEYLTLTDKGTKTYEIEIHDKNGVEWELMCDTSTGIIYEIEREVESASDPLFKKNMKVNEDAAKKAALALYPGKVVHTEYEIEANGASSYEFDIFEKPGVTYKVEVDAATGGIVEVAIEKWDIGRESHE
jgi:uncharacterized membrane protein YkoI